MKAIVPAITEKIAELKPAMTVTVDGTVRALLSLLKLTVKLEDAALLSVTVQFDVAPDARAVGRQATPETWAGAITPRLNVFGAPPELAVSVAD